MTLPPHIHFKGEMQHGKQEQLFIKTSMQSSHFEASVVCNFLSSWPLTCGIKLVLYSGSECSCEFMVK